MAKKKEETEKKWEKEAFLRSMFANKGSKHKTWASFHKAMNAACEKATGNPITELRLAMRCGAVNAALRKGGAQEWNHPARPRKTPAKPPSILDLAKLISAGK